MAPGRALGRFFCGGPMGSAGGWANLWLGAAGGPCWAGAPWPAMLHGFRDHLPCKPTQFCLGVWAPDPWWGPGHRRSVWVKRFEGAARSLTSPPEWPLHPWGGYHAGGFLLSFPCFYATPGWGPLAALGGGRNPAAADLLGPLMCWGCSNAGGGPRGGAPGPGWAGGPTSRWVYRPLLGPMGMTAGAGAGFAVALVIFCGVGSPRAGRCFGGPSFFWLALLPSVSGSQGQAGHSLRKVFCQPAPTFLVILVLGFCQGLRGQQGQTPPESVWAGPYRRGER
jgi:hypothetical protein